MKINPRELRRKPRYFLLLQALTHTHEEIQRLESELETARRHAHSAVETHAAGPHLAPGNEVVAPNKVASPGSISESDSVRSGQCSTKQNHSGLEQNCNENELQQKHNCLEPQHHNGQELNHSGLDIGLEPNLDGTELNINGLELSESKSHNVLERSCKGLEQMKEGVGQEEMEREIERLRQALRESDTECGRLARQVADLQREFDSENPALFSTTPLINTANCCQVRLFSPCWLPAPVFCIIRASDSVYGLCLLACCCVRCHCLLTGWRAALGMSNRIFAIKCRLYVSCCIPMYIRMCKTVSLFLCPHSLISTQRSLVSL